MATKKTCGCCNSSKNYTQFYKMANNSYSNICKLCMRNFYKECSIRLDSESAAMWMCLAQLNTPFISEVWQQTYAIAQNSGPNTDIISLYLKTLEERGKVYSGFWDSDKMLDQLITSNVSRSDEEAVIDWKAEIQKWGKFLDDNGAIDEDAYMFLNRKMEEYTGALELTKPAQINRYRDLCKAELRKIRLEENPEALQKDISAATSEILTLMKLLKIDNFQSDTRTEVEKTLEYQIAIMEKTKPAENEDINKYRDFCGFYELEQQLMRPLRNLVAGTKDYPSLTKEE